MNNNIKSDQILQVININAAHLAALEPCCVLTKRSDEDTRKYWITKGDT